MHPSSSSNVQQPWHFDENIYPDIILAENTHDERPYRLVEGGNLDYKRVWKLYDESPPPGYTIALVEVIYDQRMQDRFEVELNFLEQRASENAAAPFKANWVKECASSEEKNSRQHILNHLVKRSQTPSGFRHVKVLPMFHATKEAVVDSIIRVGFTVLTKEGDFSDTGFYGKGIYHTSSAKYSYGVYGSDLILLYNWVSYFAAYPINDNESDWVDKHAGKEHYKNYDTHYVLVNSANPADPKEKYFYPIKGTEAHTYDEMVTFQSNQILPRYIVHLEPTGLNLKQVPTKADTIFESILGFFKGGLTVSALIEEINKFLQSKYRTEFEKSLSNSTKKALEKELKLKIRSLSKKDPKTLLENEDAWILRQLLCIQKNKNVKITALFLKALCAKLIPQDSKRTFVGLLQSYYKSKNSIPRLFKKPLHIEQNYVQLILIADQNAEGDSKTKKTIQLNNLFDAVKEGEEGPARLAILGQAGVGKSTLCQYICYQWANGKLWNDKFEAVIWIPLRQLIYAKKEDSLCDLIYRFCILPSGRKELCADQIGEYLFQHDEKILFILDGYDEISNSLHTGGLIHDLMQEILQQKNYLITSRHHAAEGLEVDRTFENIGFSSSQVDEYIMGTLTAENGTSLQDQLKKQPWLQGIANVPINLELICSTWEGHSKAFFATISSLYVKFINDLLKRFLLRRGIESAASWELSDFEVEYSSELQFMEQLAWEGLADKKLIMSLKDKTYHRIYLEHRPVDPGKRKSFEQTILDMGLVRSCDTSSLFIAQEFEFPHLTFQEFFAAKYICRGLLMGKVSEMQKLIHLHKFNPQFQLVWSFVAGILKNQPKILQLYFRLLDEVTDLVGYYGFQVKMRCLEEVGWSEDLSDPNKDLQSAVDWLQWIRIVPKFIDDSLLKCFKSNVTLVKKLEKRTELFENSNTLGDFLSNIGCEWPLSIAPTIGNGLFELEKLRYNKTLLLEILRKRRDTGLEFLSVFFKKYSASDIYVITIKLVFESLSLQERKKYAPQILDALSRSDHCIEDICRLICSETPLLEKLLPQLLKSLLGTNREGMECGSAVLLLGLVDAQILDRYPQIISSFIEILEKNLHKEIHCLIFESLVKLLLTESKNEQIYLFFLKLQNEQEIVPNLISANQASLITILKTLERSTQKNQKNAELLKRILISSICYSLIKYDTKALAIIANERSKYFKNLSLEILSLWLAHQLTHSSTSKLTIFRFLRGRDFYWEFDALSEKDRNTFDQRMNFAISCNLEGFLDMAVSTYKNTPSYFNVLRLICYFDEKFIFEIYSKDQEGVESLLCKKLPLYSEGFVANGLMGVVLKRSKSAVKLETAIKKMYSTSNGLHRAIAAYNLCSLGYLVHENLPLVIECLAFDPHLENQVFDLAYTRSFLSDIQKPIQQEALSTLLKAFDIERSKEIGEALFAAYQRKKILLKDISEILTVFVGLYPEKRQEVLFEVLKQYRDSNLDQTESMHAHLEEIERNFYSLRNVKSINFFENIYFAYELLVSVESSCEHEKQLILNNLLVLQNRYRHGLRDGWMDCFTMVLFSEPKSSLAFINHIVLLFKRLNILEEFIVSCEDIDWNRKRQGFAPNNNDMVYEAVSLSLKQLKKENYIYRADNSEVAPALSRLIKKYPRLTPEAVEYVLFCCRRMSRYSGLLYGDAGDSWVNFLSACDLSSAAFAPELLKPLIHKSKSQWAFKATPFPHLIDRIIKTKDNNLIEKLCCEVPEAFSGSYLADFVHRVNLDEVNRQVYLRVVVLICIREGIGLFMMGDEVCFYKNGLQKYKVTDRKWFVETSQALSKTLLSDLKPIEKAI